MFGLHNTGRTSPALPLAPQPIRITPSLLAQLENFNLDEQPDQFVRSSSSSSSAEESIQPEQEKKGQELLNATAQGDKKLVYDLVVNQKVDTNYKDVHGWSALMQAARGDHLDMISTLIWGKADVDAQDKQGSTALMEAVKNESIPSVRRLLNQGPNYGLEGPKQEVEDRDGYTALHHAVKRDAFEIACMLLDEGADPNHSDRKGNSLISIAVAKNNRHMFEGLAAAGADYQPVLKYLEAESDPKKASALATLLLSVGINQLKPAELAKVLEKKPDLQPNDSSGMTPLMRAANKSNEEKVRLLLDNGASPLSRDENGRDAYSYACKITGDEKPGAALIKKAKAEWKARQSNQTLDLESL